jgi:hypothetical protein
MGAWPLILLADPAQQLSDKAQVAPGSHLQRKWGGILDAAREGSLKLEVLPKGGRFKPDSAKAKAADLEKWITTENSETAAKFLGTVPGNIEAREYEPSFSGLFLPGGGGPGKEKPNPPQPEDRTWSIASAFDVGNHAHEASGATKNGNPDGSHGITPIYEGMKQYDVDCPVTGENGEIVRMGTLIQRATAALVAKYGGDGKEQGFFEPGQTALRASKKTNTKTGQADPEHGDKNMVRVEITGTFINEAKYFIAMPKWLQLTDKDPNKQPAGPARDNWLDDFYGPLLAHEEGHKDKYEAYVKKVQAVVDAHAKTLYFGEVCYGPGRSSEAKTRATSLATDQYEAALTALRKEVGTLMRDLQEEQIKYDEITEHGAKQSKIGGQDVGYDEDLPLR